MTACVEHAVTGQAHPATVELAERLARWPLFHDVLREPLRILASRLERRAAASGEIVFLAGDPCERLYLVERGFAALRQLSPEGREHVLEYVGPGQALNLAAAVDGGPEIATAEALGDLALLSIERAAWQSLLREHAALAEAMARRLAHDVRGLSETARGLALDTVRMRLAAFLLEHAEHTPPQERWTQERIAAHIGTVRDVVGRILREFVQEGLVRRDRGELVILERKALEREAGGDQD
jgi:CRP-like cAMP-binding protein